MVLGLKKSRSLFMFGVGKEKPTDRDHDVTKDTYNTSVQTCNWESGIE
jgi:hypothetical protein